MAGNRNKNAGTESKAHQGSGRPISEEQRSRRPGREISGPGAADFLAAPGGLDLPESDSSKGTGVLREEGLVDRERLLPNLDEPDPSSERQVLTPDSPPPGKKR